MFFHTHILLGVGLFLIVNDFISFENQALALLLVLLGSILPDIDSRYSKINRWSGIVGIFVTFFFKHRGIFHSLVFHFILALIAGYFFGFIYALALFIGYSAHLIGDALTRGGVKFLYPFSNFKLRGPFKVGGFAETIIFVLLAVFILIKLFF